MANKWRAEGEKLDIKNVSGGALASNDGVVIGKLGLGVASVAIASNAYGTAHVEGVIEFVTTDTAAAWVVGDQVFWDSTTNKVTKVVASGLYFIGHAAETKSSTGTAGQVRLAKFASEGRRYLTDSTSAITLTLADFLSKQLTLTMSVAGTGTVTLPAVASVPAGARLTVVKTGSAGAITLDGNASETINGSATFASADAQYDSVTIENTGAAWFIVDRYIS